MRKRLARWWSGRTPLARAFWNGAIVYGTLLNLVTTVASLAVLAAGGPAALALTVFLMALPYNIFMVVAVWRSAARYDGPPHWATLARIAVVAWALLATVL